jgi:hypothetical protein
MVTSFIVLMLVRDSGNKVLPINYTWLDVNHMASPIRDFYFINLVFIVPLSLIGLRIRNGRVEYIRKAIVCQENLELGFILGPFQGGLGEILDRGEKEGFGALGEARHAFLRLIRAHRILPLPFVCHNPKLSFAAIVVANGEVRKAAIYKPFMQ